MVGDRPVFDTNSGLRFAPPARPALWCHDILVAPAFRMRGYFLSLMQNALALRGAAAGAPRVGGDGPAPRSRRSGSSSQVIPAFHVSARIAERG